MTAGNVFETEIKTVIYDLYPRCGSGCRLSQGIGCMSPNDRNEVSLLKVYFNTRYLH